MGAILPNCIEATRQKLRSVPTAALRVDLQKFEAVANRPLTDSAIPKRLSQAVELYHGEFLAGLTVGDAPTWNFGLLQERKCSHRRVTALLEQLIQQQRAATQFYHAEHFASQLLTLEGWREAMHRQLMWLPALTVTVDRGEKLNRLSIDHKGQISGIISSPQAIRSFRLTVDCGVPLYTERCAVSIRLFGKRFC